MNANESSGQFPQVPGGLGVLVKCEGFQCLAYQDDAGVWRDFFAGDILPPPITALETVFQDVFPILCL